MVIDVGAALAGDFDAVRADIAAVRARRRRDSVLKVIVESAALLSLAGEQTLVDVCQRRPRTRARTSSRPRPGFTRPAAPRCAPSR